MKIVAVFSILIPGMSLVLGLCLHPPVHRLASACSVRNLTVTDAHLRLMTNDYSCNNTISKSSYKIEEPFKISFTFQPMPEYRDSEFLLTVVDRTKQQLLWMVANITVYDKALTPLAPFSKYAILKEFYPPVFDIFHKEHQIEFLVFQQKSVFPTSYSQVVQPNKQPFFLSEWIDSQSRRSNVTFCGPLTFE